MAGRPWGGWTPVLVALALSGTPLHAQDGVVRGLVRYRGAPPAPRQLRVTTDRDVCGDSIPSRGLVVEGGRVRYAVVYLEGVTGGAATAAGTTTLANRGCEFAPPVLTSRAGAALALSNDDPMMHNTHLYYNQRTVGNVMLPTKAVVRNRRALSQSGLVEVKCDAHAWMRATIWVFDHPYYAVTDSSGAFEITGVPAGRYVLRISHAVLGAQDREITVQPRQHLAVEFSFGPAAR